MGSKVMAKVRGDRHPTRTLHSSQSPTPSLGSRGGGADETQWALGAVLAFEVTLEVTLAKQGQGSWKMIFGKRL